MLEGEDIQVLEVTTREGNVRNHLDLAVTSLRDDDLVAEVANTALDLDAVVQELFERRDVEDLVASGLRSVDDELVLLALVHSTGITGSPATGRKQKGKYLLGNLLGLATTSLLRDRFELAYCSISSQIISWGNSKAVRLETYSRGGSHCDWVFSGDGERTEGDVRGLRERKEVSILRLEKERRKKSLGSVVEASLVVVDDVRASPDAVVRAWFPV